MALACSTGVGGCCTIHRSTARQTHRRGSQLSPSPLLLVSLLRSRDGGGGGGSRGASQVVGARRGLSSRTRRLEERGKKGGLTTKPSNEGLEGQGGGEGEGDASFPASSTEGAFVGSPDAALPPMPDLPGMTPDFWEGPQWDGFGFFVQYLWAFGIVFALISGGIAAATYNEGATDFKQTPVYKESVMQSREELLEEEPDPSSGSEEVFDANPTTDEVTATTSSNE